MVTPDPTTPPRVSCNPYDDAALTAKRERIEAAFLSLPEPERIELRRIRDDYERDIDRNREIYMDPNRQELATKGRNMRLGKDVQDKNALLRFVITAFEGLMRKHLGMSKQSAARLIARELKAKMPGQDGKDIGVEAVRQMLKFEPTKMITHHNKVQSEARRRRELASLPDAATPRVEAFWAMLTPDHKSALQELFDELRRSRNAQLLAIKEQSADIARLRAVGRKPKSRP